MLTLKIRVPYKIGKPEDILKEFKEEIDYITAEVTSCELVDNFIQLTIENGIKENKSYDLRLLEVN